MKNAPQMDNLRSCNKISREPWYHLGVNEQLEIGQSEAMGGLTLEELSSETEIFSFSI